MTRFRKGRWHDAGQFRNVTKSTHDRCLRTCVEHRGDLTQAEYELLSEVASCWATDLQIGKSKLDRAFGILGRFAQPQTTGTRS